MKKQKKDSVEEYVKGIVKPIFDKVAQETPKNRMSVGSVRKKKPNYCIYNLHNYRLYLDFNKETFNQKVTTKTDLNEIRSVRLKNSTEYEIDDFMGCIVTVKTTQIEIRNMNESEKKHLIPISTDAKKYFKEIIEKKDNECIEVLKEIIKIYGGSSNFKILNRWGHNKIWNEDAIDLIPIKMKWNNKVSMKLYNEKNIEFPDAALASNYIETRAMESKADEVKDELTIIKEAIKGTLEVNASTSRTLNQFVTTFMPLQADFAINIKSHTAVIKNMVKATNKLNRAISKRQKKLGEFF